MISLARSSFALSIAAGLAIALTSAPGVAAGATVKASQGFKTTEVRGKAQQVARLRGHITSMIATLDANPKGLSKDVVTSLKIRVRALERAGTKAIEDGGGERTELSLWGGREDQPQIGASLKVGKGADQRYRTINLASTPSSTAVTDARTASGRKRLKNNQMVENSTYFSGGGRRRSQTSLMTLNPGSVTYGGGSSFKRVEGVEPHFGSELDMSGDDVVVTSFVQPGGKADPRRKVLGTDSVKKKAIAVSWTNADKATAAANQAIAAIVARGVDAPVRWEDLDQELGAVLDQLHLAESAVRSGADIFVKGRGEARPAHMAPLVDKGQAAVQKLARARAYVMAIYEPVHDKLGFMAAGKLSQALGDHAAPSPAADGTVPKWAVSYLKQAARNLKGAGREIQGGSEVLKSTL